MHADCIKQVRAAAGGRQISDAKIKAIDDAISGKMRDLARQDPEGWRAKSRDQRMTEAATAAMQDIQATAARKEMLAGMQAIKSAETATRIADMKKQMDRVLPLYARATGQSLQSLKTYDSNLKHVRSSLIGAPPPAQAPAAQW